MAKTLHGPPGPPLSENVLLVCSIPTGGSGLCKVDENELWLVHSEDSKHFAKAVHQEKLFLREFNKFTMIFCC